jgi:hypothetical protein
MTGRWITVANWSKFQHYKKPQPRWVKLYRDLIGHYEIMRLIPSERWVLVGLWCLAAETDNRIPADLEYLTHRLHCSVTEKTLKKLEVLRLLQLPKSIHRNSRIALVLEEESRGEESRGEKRNVTLADDVMTVFDFWAQRRKEVMGGRVKMKPTQKRLSSISARLSEGYSIDQLKQAIEGCLLTRFNVQRGFVDIELICRSQEHVERFGRTARGAETNDDFGHLG